MVLVHWDLVTDYFRSLGRSGLNYFAKLLQRGACLLGKRRKIVLYSLWRRALLSRCASGFAFLTGGPFNPE